MPDRVTIYANPNSGRGRGRGAAELISAALIRGGFSPSTTFAKPADAPVDPCAVAAVVIGGDGTLRDVAHRLFAEGGDGPPLLPVSTGTANLMSRHLGYRWTLSTVGGFVVNLIRRRRVVKLDAGSVDGRLFLLMAGAGIDGAVVHELARVRTGPIVMASYLMPLATSLAGYRFGPVTVQVDGRTVAADESGIVMVANVREYGTGLPVVPHADPTDGLLDVVVMPCRDWTGVIEILAGMATAAHLHRDGTVRVRGERISIGSSAQIPIQIDGDPAGFAPAQIAVRPGLVPFLLP